MAMRAWALAAALVFMSGAAMAADCSAPAPIVFEPGAASVMIASPPSSGDCFQYTARGNERAGGEEVAEQGDVVDRAEREDLGLGTGHGPRRADLGDRRRRLRQVEDQHAGLHALAHAPQRGIEARLDDQFVVELQFSGDALNPVQRRLVLKDGDDAFAFDLPSGGG
jgi:hypothetical protein